MHQVDDFTPALELLDKASSATILCHVHPDADTIGSGLALAIALRRKGVEVQVSFAAPARLPSSMRELPGVEFVVPADQVSTEADLLVTVDCASADRLGVLSGLLDAAPDALVLDHHGSNTRYGTVNVVDPSAESTTAVLARLFDAWGVPIDDELAHCLFAGLVTDTGSFRWVRPGTHLLAERLLATGIDSVAISRSLMDTHPFGWLPMLSRVLGSARLIADAGRGGGLVYAVVRSADIGELGSEEVESVIDIVRTCADAKVAAVFKQTAPVADAEQPAWTVSLRSRDGIDVAEVATRLGGGGHRFAAGYTVHGEVDPAVDALVEALG